MTLISLTININNMFKECDRKLRLYYTDKVILVDYYTPLY